MSSSTSHSALSKEHSSDESLDVLVVEDEPITRHAMEKLLRLHGIRAASEASAEGAMRRIHHTGLPRVLVLDVDLPGMSGLELSRRISKTRPAGRAQPMMIFITVEESPDLSDSDADLSIEYFHKPVDFGQFLAFLHNRANLPRRNIE